MLISMLTILQKRENGELDPKTVRCRGGTKDKICIVFFFINNIYDLKFVLKEGTGSLLMFLLTKRFNIIHSKFITFHTNNVWWRNTFGRQSVCSETRYSKSETRKILPTVRYITFLPVFWNCTNMKLLAFRPGFQREISWDAKHPDIIIKPHGIM